MSKRKFILSCMGKSEPVHSVGELDMKLKSALAAEDYGLISVRLKNGSPPAPWEKILYPILGLKIPENGTELTIYWAKEHAFVTFEKNDLEWVAVTRDVPPFDGVVFLKTEVGEAFSVRVMHCIPTEEAIRLFEVFFRSGKRPPGEKWIRSEQLAEFH